MKGIALLMTGVFTRLSGQTNAQSAVGQGATTLAAGFDRGDLEIVFEAASGGEKLAMLDQLDKAPSREVSAQLLRWLEKQKILMVGSENVTVAMNLNKRVASVIAAGVDEEAPAALQLYSPPALQAFFQKMHEVLSKAQGG